jgi:hypothetical protein
LARSLTRPARGLHPTDSTRLCSMKMRRRRQASRGAHGHASHGQYLGGSPIVDTGQDASPPPASTGAFVWPVFLRCAAVPGGQ